MLVLTRKSQQQIIVGENIKITVLSVKGNNVRIGVEAPRDVRVIRTEIADRPAKPAQKVAETASTEVTPRLVGRDHTAVPAVDPFVPMTDRSGVKSAQLDLHQSTDHQVGDHPTLRMAPMMSRVVALRSATAL